MKCLTFKLDGFVSVLLDTYESLPWRLDLTTSLGLHGSIERCPDRIVNLNLSISRNGEVEYTKDWTPLLARTKVWTTHWDLSGRFWWTKDNCSVTRQTVN